MFTREDFHKLIVEKRIELIRSVLITKNLEYCGDKSPFHNFKSSTGLSFHDSAEKVCWEFAVKHLQSIKDILNDVELGNMPSEALITEKFGDAINYLILMEGMLKEKLPASDNITHRINYNLVK
jgi:hypothetical protein